MKPKILDAITLELIWTRMISIVDEAAASLVRTSFSTIVRESNDFACVLTDAAGHSLAQATDSIPSFINTVPRTIRHFLDEYPADTLKPSDILITNDIWMGTGHLPDITVAKPIFLGGTLVGFAGSVAHAPDIGGRQRSADAREVFEEGLQIPVMKVMVEGVMDKTFERILRKNVREPGQVMGDLYAQFTALQLIETRVAGLMAEQNLATLEDVAREIHGRSEAAMREAIRRVPEGVYRQTAISDGFDKPIVLEMAMTVKDGTISVDFAGSALQVPMSINVCPSSTSPLKMVIRALADAMPDRVIATVGSPLWCVNLAGSRPGGGSFANIFFMNGGYGAAHNRDGQNVLSWPSNISSTPVEMIEQLSPLHVEFRRLRADGGGPGTFRGGTGQEIKFENRAAGPISVTFLAERTRPEAAAAGIAGGESGAPGEVIIDGKRSDPKARHVIAPGGTIELRTPGGGGFGPPSKRSAQHSESDRLNGYVSGK